MRALLALAVICTAATTAVRTVTDGLVRDTPAPGARVPVLVELFTSEGCSSCPPADRVLAGVARRQPIAGADVIVMSEHVDYWNRLGWRDPFSSAASTDRQRAYARLAFPSAGIYTPQLIVNGREQLIGSDESGVLAAIGRAASMAPPLTLELGAPSADPQGLSVPLRVTPVAGLDRDAEVLVAVVENGLESAVTAGENVGRHLSHVAVVRGIVLAGRVGRRGAALDTVVRVPLEAAWTRERLELVAFAQDTVDRRVLGAARGPGPNRTRGSAG